MTKRELRCIVAGFDPFGGAKSNPSGEIANLFPDLITVKGAGNFPVEKLLFPTCCKESWKVLKKALKQYKDEDVVLLVSGLAESRMVISLERVALNLRDYRIKDNNGHQHEAAKIEPGAENALFTTVPVDKVKKTLIKKGIPCEVSNHAGAFVCNEIYFKSLTYQSAHKHLQAALFVHVPLPKNFMESIKKAKQKPALVSLSKKSKTKSKQQELAIMQESVQLALLECIKHIHSGEKHLE